MATPTTTAPITVVTNPDQVSSQINQLAAALAAATQTNDAQIAAVNTAQNAVNGLTSNLATANSTLAAAQATATAGNTAVVNAAQAIATYLASIGIVGTTPQSLPTNPGTLTPAPVLTAASVTKA